MPLPTGSPTADEDDGDGAGRALGRLIVGERACVTMTSTFSRTSSAASSGSRSAFRAAQRYSMMTLRPST